MKAFLASEAYSFTMTFWNWLEKYRVLSKTKVQLTHVQWGYFWQGFFLKLLQNIEQNPASVKHREVPLIAMGS